MARIDRVAKSFDPKIADAIYERWETNGAFRAERDPDKTPYTIVMPPPNITGELHLGHALDNTLQDVLIRWNVYKDIRRCGLERIMLPLRRKLKLSNSCALRVSKSKNGA